MDNIIETFRDEAEKKGIEIETIYSDKDIKITGDKFSLERLFKNIIRNAIEAIPGGGTLSIYITSKSQAVEIRFKDTGHGIPADKINGLFTEFTTTKGDGIGLGLAISKRIIEAHNGTISIESEVGKGTTVRITLPLSGNSKIP
jgi:two-component system, sporulation sensor kinase E